MIASSELADVEARKASVRTKEAELEQQIADAQDGRSFPSGRERDSEYDRRGERFGAAPIGPVAIPRRLGRGCLGWHTTKGLTRAQTAKPLHRLKKPHPMQLLGASRHGPERPPICSNQLRDEKGRERSEVAAFRRSPACPIRYIRHIDLWIWCCGSRTAWL